MRLLLGFGNKARHGKDSAAQAIKDSFDHTENFNIGPYYPEVRIFKFAEALYEECRRDHGMIEKDPLLLQKVGQGRREENPRHWIERLEFKMKNFNGIGIITDVRYTNEAQWVKNLGGFLINVTRLNEDGIPFVAPDRPANHISETELDGWPWDAFIRTYSGQEALAGEQAATIANFFYQITEPENV